MKVNLKHTVDDIEGLLKYRGISDIEQFKNPDDSMLEDPANLNNIDKAYKTLKKVIDNNSRPKILLLVDSDADGNTSSAVMWLYLKNHYNIEADWIIHTKKQHGLEDKIDELENESKIYDLLIQADSGSNDAEFHKRLYEATGATTIVLDHHLQDINADEHAIIVNNQMSINYSNKALSGVGVVWQFCRYVDRMENTNDAVNYIDLVALGCISDMMVGTTPENRFIYWYGLQHLKNKFFKEMVAHQAYSIGNELTQLGVAFYITPLINGMIRSGEQNEKEMMFQAFIQPDTIVSSSKRGHKGEPVNICEEVVRLCVNARARQNRLLEKMEERIDGRIMEHGLLDNKILFVKLTDEDKDFPSEINGLLANRLVGKYQRPVMLGRENEDGVDKGSIRGVNGSELTSFKNFLEDSGLMEYVQGHDNAAGWALPSRSENALIDYANKNLANINFTEGYYNIDFNYTTNDSELFSNVVDATNWSDVFGQGNPEPIFYVHNINLTPASFTIMGKNKDTVKFLAGGITFIKFKATDFIKDLADSGSNICLSIVGRANKNEYMGRITYQLFIDDYEINGGEIDDSASDDDLLAKLAF